MIAFDEKAQSRNVLFLSFFFLSRSTPIKKIKKTLSLDQIFSYVLVFFPEREGNIKRTDVQTHVAPRHAAVQSAACEKRCRRFCWRLIAAADLIEFDSNIEKDNSA